ncbi:MAG: glycosyltransferase family 2 protein [Lacibacter sp.]
MEHPLISICIPAYKRIAYLKRLLDSIDKQTFLNYEVIITDDSPDNSISDFLRQNNYSFIYQYIKNEPAKGTPLNWLEGIKYAKGEWIKIIHDDDWLTNGNSLQLFANAISDSIDCIFSGYIAYFEKSDKAIDKTISLRRFQRIARHPYFLFSSNELGPPSVVMFRRSIRETYDPAFKWLVDIEAYIRIFNHYKCVYINKPLITMSYNDTQVTNDCFRNPEIEIREALIYYYKHGPVSCQRILTYDAWWRLIRNLNIRSLNKLISLSSGFSLPFFLVSILQFQKFIPAYFLKYGFISKILMLLSYYKSKIITGKKSHIFDI